MDGMTVRGSGPFPREFRKRLWKNPDWLFLLIFALCAFFIGGTVFVLSLHEPPRTVGEKEIVRIRERYAKLVLNAPARWKDEKKDLPIPQPPERKENVEPPPAAPPPALKEEVVVKPPPPLVRDERPEEPEAAEVEPPEVPEVAPEPPAPVELQDEGVEMEMEEDGGIDVAAVPDVSLPPPGLPDRYAARRDGDGVSIEPDMVGEPLTSPEPAPSIPDVASAALQVRTERRGDGGGIELDDERVSVPVGLPPAPKVGGVPGGGYGLPAEKGMAPSATVEMPAGDDAQVLGIVSKSPDIGPKGGRRRYVAARGGSGVTVEAEGEETVEVVSVARREPEVPDTVKAERLSSRYGQKPRKRRKTAVLSAAERKDKGMVGERKGAVDLPETTDVRHLKACIDPAEEPRLRSRILAALGDDTAFCEDERGRFGFYDVEMLATLSIRYESSVAGELSRCDALRMALECLLNKSKR